MRLVCQALDKFREADDKAGEAGVKSFRMRQVFQLLISANKDSKSWR